MSWKIHLFQQFNSNCETHVLNTLCTQTEVVFGYFNCDDFGSNLTKTHVHLLYMYSIVGKGSFCFNYCLDSAWHGGDQCWHF